MRPSKVRDKLSRDEQVLVTSLHLGSPAVFELTSLMGFDCIWIDLEHHSLSLETAESLMRAARVGGADIIARPAKGEFMRLGRLLEAGAQGIMYPRCDSAEEAAELVKWAKFPPLGARGIDGGNPDMPYCSMPMDEYVKAANEQTFIVVQLEQQHAIDRAEEIAAVEGVDVIFIGPGDFSALSGFPGQMDHPRLTKAIEHVAAAARRAGKHWGMPAMSVSSARTLVEQGARFITYASDIVTLKRGLSEIQREFSALGFSFDNKLPNAGAAHRGVEKPHIPLSSNGHGAKPDLRRRAETSSEN